MEESDNIEAVNDLIDHLAKASDRQLDKSMREHLSKLKGKPVDEMKKGFRYAIDLSVYGSLASDFVISAMSNIYEKMLDGSQTDFNDDLCPWRTDIGAYKYEYGV